MTGYLLILNVMLAIDTDHESKNYERNEEISALESNDTWTVTNLSYDKYVIRCRWRYKIKRKVYGRIGKYKARLVEKEYPN